MSDYQLPSWCDPYGSPHVSGLVGQIHFPTDVATLDGQDQRELAKLRSPYSIMLLGRRVHVWCVGHADHRASGEHNRDLGERRAQAVQRHLDRMLGSQRLYSSAPVTTRGEEEAAFPMPDAETMAADRRVDIFTTRVANRPPVELPERRIFGRLPPAITITEVMAPGRPRGPINWTPATRESRPPPIGEPGDRRGRHPVDLLPRALRLANQAAVESAIADGIEEIRPVVAWRMMDHASGGILVVAVIDVREQGGQTAGSVMYVTDHSAGVFARPEHAIGRWRGETHLDAPSADPPFGRIEYRYYWATRE